MSETDKIEAVSEPDEYLSRICDILAGLYYDREKIRNVVETVGLDTPDFDNRLLDVWRVIVENADSNNRIDELVSHASKEFPENVVLRKVLDGEMLNISTGPSFLDSEESPSIPWDDSEDISTLEKIIGDQNNLLPISFLEVGLEKSRSVARILLEDGAVGTGFLTTDNLLVTNNHVIPTEEVAASAIVEFNFQKNSNGLDLPTTQCRCSPTDGFKTSSREENDWTIVRLEGNQNAEWGAISLAERPCEVRDRVLIIQHPGGSHKAIGLYHNLVTSVTETRIQYLTDTMPGSSGSPVFDNDWNLVAVHHSGGWLREPRSKATLFRNQGITVSCLLEAFDELASS